MFVFFDVELIVLVPALSHAKLETLNAVLNSAVVVALTFAGITIVSKKSGVRGEFAHALISWLFQDYDHESGDKERRVRQVHTVVGCLGEVVNFGVSFVLLRLKKLLKFSAVAVDIGQI